MDTRETQAAKPSAMHPIALQLEGEYFEDMILEDEAMAPILGRIDHCNTTTLPSIQRASFEKLDDGGLTVGRFDPESETIFIKVHDGASIDIVDLLHEMVHFYEHELAELNPALNEYLLIFLWRKLSSEIPDLDERILSFVDLEPHSDLESLGGRHGVLFLLKSFDLDLRLGEPLGTVFGYGMAGDADSTGPAYSTPGTVEDVSLV